MKEKQEPPVFSETINEQLKHDAPFAWFLRHQGCHSPIFRLADIERLDERLTNFLNAIYLSEVNGTSLADSLNLSDWGARFVLFWLGIESGKQEYCLRAIEGIEDKEESDELAEAFSWFSQLDKIIGILKMLGDTPNQSPWVKRAAIHACKLNHLSLTEEYIVTTLSEGDDMSVVAILDYITSQRLDYQQQIIPLLNSENEEVVLASLIALSYQLGYQSFHKDFYHFISEDNFQLKTALKHALIVADTEEIRQILSEITRCQYSQRIRIYSIGVSGLIEYLPELISLTQNQELAKAAGESISMITGIDIEEGGFSLAHESHNNVDDFDEIQDSWKTAYEDDLPLPNPDALSVWWKKEQVNFKASARYLAGLPIQREHLKQVLLTGNQIQRDIAAYHLANIEKNQIVVQVSACYREQHRQLSDIS